jgi:dipeptidyl aminopeptidase/acylaminoacyl peptidase
MLVALPLLAQQSSGGRRDGESGIAPGESAPAAKALLPAADYDKIEALGGSALSPDGKWVVYDVRRESGGTELHYRPVASDRDQTVPLGAAGNFTRNSRWLLYTISSDTMASPSNRGRFRARRERTGGYRPPTNAGSDSIHHSVGIVDLGTGATTMLRDVQWYSLSEDGVHAALRRYSPKGHKGRGADLVVRDLERGTDVTFGNVAEFVWSDDGALLAMAIDVDGRTGNGVQVYSTKDGTLRPLDASDMWYSGLQWRRHSHDLSVLRSHADSGFADTNSVVVAWRGVGGQAVSKAVYDFTADSAFPKGMRVTSYLPPVWSDDGSTVYFGIAARTPAHRGGQDADSTAPMPARVEVWHWKDLREYHQQDREAAQDRERALLVAWRPGTNRLVRLTDDSYEDMELSEDGGVVLAESEAPYFDDIITGRAYRDVAVIDPATGTRKTVVSKSAYGGSMSPSGRYVLYLQDGQWWSYDVTTGARANLTGGIKSTFVNVEDDHPVAVRRPYGIAGWTTGEKTVILQDRYDLWEVRPDGTHPVRLTQGREDSTVYRIVPLDPDARTIDPRSPIWLSATGEYNKRSGVARLVMGQQLRRLLWLDAGVSRLAKARDADVFAYVAETYEQSPNLFVSSGAFTAPTQVSHTNAFLSDYAWGTQQLLQYVNTQGDTLQMMLTYPANYVPGKQYPMVVYYYEHLSQGFHQFVAPSRRATYNTTVFSQNGYFVLRPDIRFRARNPGYSGLDCVTSAVKAVLATGMIDPKHVGNMGHSWGGYQSAFYAVHGHGMFAATIAGAPLTDLISMYGYTSFNTGLPETGHFETGQERMQVPLWEDPQAYIRNSTVFAVDSLQMPLLLEEGDADGNVNYWQSMELYNFGRRLGKHVILLLYNDENHGVARRESQMDYHTRQLEWFNHFLKGEPAPAWITEGETYLARQQLLADACNRKKKKGAAPGVVATAGTDGGGGGSAPEASAARGAGLACGHTR